MNCHLGGAIPHTGGSQKRASGAASAKYSQRGFHGAVDGAASEREPIGRLSGREVHRIHRWGRTSDEDGYGLHAENAGPHQGF